MRSRTVLFCVLVCWLCAGAMCIPADSSPPDLRDADLMYREIGDFRDHTVRVAPNGQVFLSEGRLQDLAEPVGQLSNEQGNRLNALLQGWDSLPSVSSEPPCCGGLGYGITYQDREQSWATGQLGVPLRLYQIAQFIQDVEQGL